MELVRRKNATEATLAKYRGKAFDWRAGCTCVHLLRFHLRKMGHKVEPMPRVRSAIAARRQLDLRGCKDVADLLDTMLPRIPYSRMILGDIAVLQSPDEFGAITICAGGSKVLGWHEDVVGMAVLDASKIEGAWRV